MESWQKEEQIAAEYFHDRKYFDLFSLSITLCDEKFQHQNSRWTNLLGVFTADRGHKIYPKTLRPRSKSSTETGRFCQAFIALG